MSEQGRYSFSGLDRLFHERARLGIMTSLVSHADGILFPNLKVLCDLTDGNLNRHLSVLEEAECIEIWKSGAGRKQQTLVRMTAIGRQKFLEYLGQLETVIRAASAAAEKRSGLPDLGFSAG
jgi:hypothetical protein